MQDRRGPRRFAVIIHRALYHDPCVRESQAKRARPHPVRNDSGSQRGVRDDDDLVVEPAIAAGDVPQLLDVEPHDLVTVEAAVLPHDAR